MKARFADLVVFVCVVVFAGLYLWATSQIPSLEIGDPLGPKAFPDLLGIALLLAAGMLLLEIIKAREDAEPAPESEAQAGEQRGHLLVITLVTAWTSAYYLVFEPLGFIVSTAIFLLGLTTYFNRGKWIANSLTSVLFVVVTYALFVKALGVTLAPGILSF